MINSIKPRVFTSAPRAADSRQLRFSQQSDLGAEPGVGKVDRQEEDGDEIFGLVGHRAHEPTAARHHGAEHEAAEDRMDTNDLRHQRARQREDQHHRVEILRQPPAALVQRMQASQQRPADPHHGRDVNEDPGGSRDGRLHRTSPAERNDQRENAPANQIVDRGAGERQCPYAAA
jgi:hypothetical protein